VGVRVREREAEREGEREREAEEERGRRGDAEGGTRATPWVIRVLKLISVVFRTRCGPLISAWHCC